MPELPDLEVFKTNIFDRLSSKRLTGAEAFNPQKVRASGFSTPESYVGRELLRIGRVGKELVFDFGEGRTIAAHLMLNGEVSVVPPEAVGAVRCKIFALRFEREAVVFSDMGGLCTIRCQPAPDAAPDVFAEAFTWDYFRRAAGVKARANVKAFLIDQKVMKGIGNAYADEILWAARISPHCLVGAIPQDRLEALYLAIGTVLREAVESIRRISPDRISGEERSFLKVHQWRTKQTETGYPIKVEYIASKKTYYTEEQALYS
jgi:formamidopyrimidine-DNA glycosylase